MAAGDSPSSGDRRGRRPLLGLRTPGRLALRVFRFPVPLYRRGWGWMLGRTFLVLTHVGRTTGRRHQTAAMVLTHDAGTRESVICSAWGPDTDWIRNIRAHPAVEVRIGREAYVPEQRFLTDEEAFAVAITFRRDHPWRLRVLSTLLGWGDLSADEEVRAFVRDHPFVAVRPTDDATGHRESTGARRSHGESPSTIPPRSGRYGPRSHDLHGVNVALFQLS